MGKLLETFNQIERGRQKCVDALNGVGINTDDNAALDVIASKIQDKAVGVDFPTINHMWTRPEEWIDTEDLLRNAPELEGYTPVTVYLLRDNRPSISLTLSKLQVPSGTSTTSSVRDAYYLSDGTFITHSSTTSDTTIQHTWDTTKDIKTGLGYNLRYAIAYMLSAKMDTITTFGVTNDYSIGLGLLEMVCNNPQPTRKATFNIPQRASNYLDLQRLHILDCDCGFTSGSNAYNSIKEIQIDKSGVLDIGEYAIFIYSSQNYEENNKKLLIPNASELRVGFSNSSGRLSVGYLYVPNVTTLTLNGNSGSLTTVLLYAPKLSTTTLAIYTSMSSTEFLHYAGSLKTKNKVSFDYRNYMDPFTYNNDSDTINLSTTWLNSILIFNPLVKHIEDTGIFAGYPYSIKLPSLKTIANPDIFTNTNYSKYISELIIGDGFKSSINLSKLVYLPTVNILDILNKLADVTGEEETYTLTLGTTLLTLLSDEEKAIATNKGWVLA